MCYEVQCPDCKFLTIFNDFILSAQQIQNIITIIGKLRTWAGCGRHKDGVMAKIPPDEQCKCNQPKQNNNNNNNDNNNNVNVNNNNDKNDNKEKEKDNNNNNNVNVNNNNQKVQAAK